MIFSVLISSPIGVDWRNSCLLPTKKYKRTCSVLKKIAKYQNCYNGIIKKRVFKKVFNILPWCTWGEVSSRWAWGDRSRSCISCWWRSISAKSLFVILHSPRASFRSIHRLCVDSLRFRRLMPSGLLGRPLAGRLCAILADVSTKRDRKPSTQCPWKEFCSTNVNHKDSSQTIEVIKEETGP